ncbi:MAG TPA: hypothetical protein VFS20_25135 [Longimicrobium sp.]|nr:hypothetical protein [Longimicrobium sp.]
MRLPSATALVSLLLLGSCNVLPTTCTLIGCTDGVNVTFNRQAAAPFRVEALVPGSEPVVFDCPTANSCTGSSAFLAVVADEMTIRVTTPSGTVTQQVRPQYKAMYPNGRDCGAVCKQAEVTIELPG